MQRVTDTEGHEVTGDDIWRIFTDEYLPAEDGAHTDLEQWGRLRLREIRTVAAEDGTTTMSVDVFDRGDDVTLEGSGNGPVAAFVDAIAHVGVQVKVLDYAEHALSEGGDAQAAAYVEALVGDDVLWGVGIDPPSRRRPSSDRLRHQPGGTRLTSRQARSSLVEIAGRACRSPGVQPILVNDAA